MDVWRGPVYDVEQWSHVFFPCLLDFFRPLCLRMASSFLDVAFTPPDVDSLVLSLHFRSKSSLQFDVVFHMPETCERWLRPVGEVVQRHLCTAWSVLWRSRSSATLTTSTRWTTRGWYFFDLWPAGWAVSFFSLEETERCQSPAVPAFKTSPGNVDDLWLGLRRSGSTIPETRGSTAQTLKPRR